MGKEGYSVRMEVKRGWAVAEMKVGRHQKRSSENFRRPFDCIQARIYLSRLNTILVAWMATQIAPPMKIKSAAVRTQRRVSRISICRNSSLRAYHKP